MSRGDPVEQQVVSSIYGILFFGTPHRGLRIEQWLPMVQDRPNRALIQALEPDSPYLNNLYENFITAFHYPDSILIAFYETEETQVAEQAQRDRWTATGPYQRLVEVSSATNSHPLERKTISIQANHQNMIKFSDGQDENYHNVLAFLADFQQMSLRVIPQRLLGPARSPTLLGALRRLTRMDEKPNRRSGGDVSAFTESPTFASARTLRPDLEDTQRVPGRLLRLWGRVARHGNDDPGIERLDNYVRRRPPRNVVAETENDVQELENYLEREEYQQQRITNGQMQRSRSRVTSVRQLGTLLKADAVDRNSGSSYVIGNLEEHALGFERSAFVEVPRSTEYWECSIMLVRDSAGIVHHIVSERLDRGGKVVDSLPSGIGAVPHVEQEDDDRSMDEVTFLEDHHVRVYDSTKSYPFDLRPKYLFVTAAGTRYLNIPQPQCHAYL